MKVEVGEDERVDRGGDGLCMFSIFCECWVRGEEKMKEIGNGWLGIW